MQQVPFTVISSNEKAERLQTAHQQGRCQQAHANLLYNPPARPRFCNFIPAHKRTQSC